jgi:DNA ligase (NAD+)
MEFFLTRGWSNMNIYDYESLILKVSKNEFKGKTFCFTGKSTHLRQDLEKMVIDVGGVPKERVTKSLNYLVYAENDDNAKYTSKYYLAQDYGVKILRESEFLEMVKK